jgi:hypothetical protein
MTETNNSRIGVCLLSLPLPEIRSGILKLRHVSCTLTSRTRTAKEVGELMCTWCHVGELFDDYMPSIVGALWYLDVDRGMVEYWLGTHHCYFCARASRRLESWLQHEAHVLLSDAQWERWQEEPSTSADASRIGILRVVDPDAHKLSAELQKWTVEGLDAATYGSPLLDVPDAHVAGRMEVIDWECTFARKSEEKETN